MVDFPLPGGPTMPVTRPGLTSKLTSRSTGGALASRR